MRCHFGAILAFLVMSVTAASAQTINLHCGAPGSPSPFTLMVDLGAAQVTFAYDNPGFQNQNYSAPARITDATVVWNAPGSGAFPNESNVLSRYTLVLTEYPYGQPLTTPCSAQKPQF